MRAAARVFLAQFVYILLLGAQQLNVVHTNYAGAALVSAGLGVIGFSLTATIAEVKREATYGPVWWAFVLAGPLGICAAMISHPYLEAAWKSM